MISVLKPRNQHFRLVLLDSQHSLLQILTIFLLRQALVAHLEAEARLVYTSWFQDTQSYTVRPVSHTPYSILLLILTIFVTPSNC